MKSITYALSLVSLGLTVVLFSGCSGGSGYSSVGVSSGNYWGSYGSYRPSYSYDYRYSSDYRKRERHRSQIGRPSRSISGGQQRARPEARANRSRPARRR